MTTGRPRSPGSDVRALADKISGVVYCRDDVLQPESFA